MPEDRLDEVLNEMRNENIPPEEVAAATGRVWRRIAASTAAVCPEFREDLEAYAAARLEGSRRLLLEDHLARCPACRRTLARLQGKPAVQPMPVVRGRTLPVWSRWAIAAGLAAAALYLGRGPLDRALAPSGPRATVVAVKGAMHRLPQGVLLAGATLGEGEPLRTGLGARAVLRLRDGSLVEVNERTELSVQSAWSGQTVRLERGDVIVEAAKQRRGRLRVVTSDSVASVKGTVFAVSAGLAGTLVSVVEGSVQVTQPGGQRVLVRGQQAASTPAAQGIPVRASIAWSENAGKYYELLGELARIEAAVAAGATPAPRTQSRLLAQLPSDAVVYVALPNLGPAIDQAVNLIEQRSAESAVLREWWTSAQSQHFKDLVNDVHTLSPLLGDEVVFVMSKSPAESSGAPLAAMLAEVQPGRQAGLRQALDSLFAGKPAAASVSDTLLVVSDSQAHLTSMLGRLGKGASSRFAAEIAAHYRDGVGVLFAADASTVAGKSPAAGILGTDKLRYVFFEQRQVQSSDELSASLTFDGPRTGIASWLASPAVAGSAEYVTAAAVGAVSACTRNPRQAFEEFLELAVQAKPEIRQELADLEAKAGVRVAEDVAAALGTDFTFAVERPSIPLPGWVAAIEVNQPSVLDAAVRRIVEAVNREVGPTGQAPRLVLAQEAADGRTWTSLRNTKLGLTLYWSYDRGYWVLSLDRGLAAQAIATRASGVPLVRSELFRAQLPASSGLRQSGFLWFNPQGPLADVAALMGGEQLKALLQSREPILLVVNGETERIRLASRTRLMSMLLTMTMAGGPGRSEHGSKSASH
jgi:hypothetical protein